MSKTNTYHNKIKIVIITVTLISQIFMFFSISGSCILLKHSRYRDMLLSLSNSYEQRLNSLSTKIDNMIYMFETSGALDFCGSYPAAFGTEETMYEEYNKICHTLDYSATNNHYFSSYYLIGQSYTPLSLAKESNKFLSPTALNLDYSFIFRNFVSNGFTDNYQNLFYFDKTACNSLKAPIKYEKAFSSFLDKLDGKLIYCTIRNDIFCILVINDSFFNDVYKTSCANSISVLIENAKNKIIFQQTVNNVVADKYKDIRSAIHITGDRYTLTLIPHININIDDFLLMFISLLLCCVTIFHAIYWAERYAEKILRPYQIIINLFRLNKDIETFDKSLYHNSVHTRSEINKLFFKTFVHTTLIPSLASLTILSIILYGYTANIYSKNLDSIHENTISELRDSFDTFIVQNFLERQESYESFSRSAYTVTLNDNFLLESIPFKDKEYVFSSKLNSQLRKVKPLAENGMLVNIHSDIFDDKAIGVIHNSHDGSYFLSVIKSESIANVRMPLPIGYILTDSENSIIAQSSFISQNINNVLGNKSSRFIRQYVFPEYNWILYTFADKAIVNNIFINTYLLNGLIIALLLLMILLLAWNNAISLVQPIEKIIKSMLKNDMHEIESHDSYDSEIKELISVYNNMIHRINIITNEKILLASEKEQLNSLKIQTEMNALQHQINPHFLYNTLNMISLNAKSFTTDDIMKITSALSNIFRYSSDADDSEACLDDEFDNLDNYIYIWLMRFPERFHIYKDIVPDTKMIPTIKLILQPIVENCFIHAFDNMVKNCCITIKSYIEDDNVVISISDNGHGISNYKLCKLQEKIKNTTKPLTGKGIGLRNVYQRLMLAYGDAFDFTIESIEEQGTTVTVRFDIYADPF